MKGISRLWITVAIVVAGCSSGQVTTPNGSASGPTVSEPPKSEDIISSFPTVQVEPTSPPSTEIRALSPDEPCNGRDDDGDGMIDEGCCGCCTGAKLGDATCDQAITKMDQACILLVTYRKTVSLGGMECMDVDQDGSVSMNDAVEAGNLGE